MAAVVKGLIFRQLFKQESSTYSYLVGDEASEEAMLIDPVLETAERDAQIAKDMGLNVEFALNTHCYTGMFPQNLICESNFCDRVMTFVLQITSPGLQS